MDDAGIRAALAAVYSEFGYTACPHTACAFAGLTGGGWRSGGRTRVVLATAHPAKFPDAVLEATGVEPRHPTLERLKDLPLRTTPLPADAGAVRALIGSGLGA
jgi:threonine synthase